MPIQPGPGEEAVPPSIDLSEDVFSDEPAGEALIVGVVSSAPVEAEVEVPEAAVEAPEAGVEAPEVEVEVAPEPAPEDTTVEQPVASSADEPEAVAGTAPGSDDPAPE
jgi:hypothetical protein